MVNVNIWGSAMLSITHKKFAIIRNPLKTKIICFKNGNGQKVFHFKTYDLRNHITHFSMVTISHWTIFQLHTRMCKRNQPEYAQYSESYSGNTYIKIQ